MISKNKFLKSVMLVASIGLTMMTASCGSSKSASGGKAEKSTVAQLAKELKSKGYSTTTMAWSIEEQIQAHRDKLRNNPELVELTIETSDVSEGIGQLHASNQASTDFATRILERAKITGTDKDAGGNINKETWESFSAEYMRFLPETLAPKLQTSLKFKAKEFGKSKLWIVYVVDQETTKKASMDSAKKALSLIKASDEIGDKIIDSIEKARKQFTDDLR